MRLGLPSQGASQWVCLKIRPEEGLNSKSHQPYHQSAKAINNLVLVENLGHISQDPGREYYVIENDGT